MSRKAEFKMEAKSTGDKKKGIKQYLDNIFSEEGLKTDIKITLTNETLFKTSATLIGTAVIITILVRVIWNAGKPKVIVR